MPEVRFAAYRDYEAARVEANNAVMALLAGAQLAAHLLQLTQGSQRVLSEVYPAVPHIARFDMKSETAREILHSADVHLGAMSVPYALSIHEDFLKTCLHLLARAGRCSVSTAENTKFHGQHTEIAAATRGQFSPVSLKQLDVLRLMRNCQIHRRGRASSVLVATVAGMSPAAETEWIKVAGRTARELQVGERVTFQHGEMVLALAVTKQLAREANKLLQLALSRELWADLVVEDLMLSDPHARGASNALRRLRGLARHDYGNLGLTDAELKAALARK